MTATRRELRRLTRLASPVIATQLGTMTLGVVDVVMLGHYGVEALASSSLARVWLMGTAVFVQGLLLGLDPFISQAHGRRDAAELGATLQRGLVLALVIAPLLGAAWILTEPFLKLTGAGSELAAAGGSYALARLPGLPAFLVFLVLRSWLQGRGLMRPAMWVVLGANLVNVAANAVLIFGGLGLPALGVRGAGLATSITQWVMLLGLLAIVRGLRLQRGAWRGWRRDAWRGAGRVLSQGVPMGLHLGVEIWAFQLATLMANPLGTEAIASHSVALNLASISFMVPLGVSIAAAARVGNLIGEERLEDAQESARVAMYLGGLVMAFFAALFLLFRRELPALYNDDTAVIDLAAAILPIAAAFQLFDGLQVVAAGILRGMGRTRILPILHFTGFYVIGLPFAWWLAYERGVGVPGIWWGLCLGLSIVALVLVVWIARRGPASLAVSSGATAPRLPASR